MWNSKLLKLFIHKLSVNRFCLHRLLVQPLSLRYCLFSISWISFACCLGQLDSSAVKDVAVKATACLRSEGDLLNVKGNCWEKSHQGC